MNDQKEDKTNFVENSSPVCYQNDPDIQKDYLLNKPKIKKTKKTKQVESKEEDQ
ncbi:hypothetical protein Q4534_05755 [Cyclobacterium sp. 1_MG-2023]|uniref:hypothetical protein n=1 Tax=Cyclobacterium sp. 1_MG-2023 TaxID=3062681 RepID=UPI0026E3914F|nr:hypothetical protein [Cyclobacterium sp. 1_MG-2023]MDO6436900.1 hypothetical protein [Cyclobacterium sp. 1_MG-2023]